MNKMMDTDEIMRKTQRMCDLVNAIAEERDYAFEFMMGTKDEELKAKYAAQLELLDHLLKKYIL